MNSRHTITFICTIILTLIILYFVKTTAYFGGGGYAPGGYMGGTSIMGGEGHMGGGTYDNSGLSHGGFIEGYGPGNNAIGQGIVAGTVLSSGAGDAINSNILLNQNRSLQTYSNETEY